ncbi:hypothetical protein KRMM14A1004_39980 [Krasilnikovia sp. MM14-A1004]
MVTTSRMPEDARAAPFVSDGRRLAVLRAAKVWADQLIDRSGRNEMIFCKDRGKLLLADAAQDARDRLLRAQPVRLRELFVDDGGQQAAFKAAERIRKRIKEYDEERGVRVGRLVRGFATWTDSKDRAARAPVLLRDIQITKSAIGVEDLELTADPDLEINPVLLNYLAVTFGVKLDPELVDELNDAVDDPAGIEDALDRLRIEFAQVPGFGIEPGNLIGTFHYAKQAMYQDLTDNAGLFAASDLFAAIAGDTDAVTALRQPVGEVTRDQPDLAPPQDEFLVLDADPSQHYVINAAVAGRNLVVQGPPGTGKSQTISNLISSLTARGKKVLFVAEKRAAIEAVLNRLDRVGLGGLTLDLHLTTANRGAAYQQFRDAIADSRRVPPIDAQAQHAQLSRARKTMSHHPRVMHTPMQPWGVSVFDAQASMLGTPEPARTPARVPHQHLRALHGDLLAAARERVARLADIGGLRPADAQGPWATANINTREEGTRALDDVRLLRLALADLRREAAALTRAAGLPQPSTSAEANAAIQLCARVADVAARWRPEVYEQDLHLLLAATGNKAFRRRVGSSMGFWERRRRCKEAGRLRTTPAGDLHADLANVLALCGEWQQLTGQRVPAVSDLGQARAELAHATDLLARLVAVMGRDLSRVSWDDAAAQLAKLAADPTAPARAVEVKELLTELRRAGFGELLAWFTDNAADWEAGHSHAWAVAALNHAWNGSVLDHARASDPHLATFDGRHHTHVAAEFAEADRGHIQTTARRVARITAERLTATRTHYPNQDQFLDKELGRKRKLKPIRDLLAAAPDVLLAAKPCWAMSPLMVSQMLPPQQLFDVVIFDEASQVQPAEAMPSLARANQAVVAGDSRQLPPSRFFEERDELTDDSDADEDDLLTEDVESVLDAFNRALGQSLAHEYYLGWHYRSADPRLIEFSNAHFYDNRITTFPGTAVEPPLTFTEVIGDSTAGGSGTSERATAAEVDRVVDLMIEHVQQRSDESLGVIALSAKHADRIEAALTQRLRSDPSLQNYFDEQRTEPYFIKNLERVQGDERDAIILSVGFGKVNGRLQRRFGPINLAGGERRLNVAVTRAKHRMAVVASFSPNDLDPSKLNTDGARALASYLRYAASGGQDLDGKLRDTPALNPFEISVRDRLVAAGIDVVCQWGVGGYRIDFAAKHPTQPGRMILAIEADGATYHSAETARARDRLRQDHLERLGWRFHRIWSTDWFNHPQAELDKVRAAYDAAVRAADEAPSNASHADTPTDADESMGAATRTPERGPRPPVPRGLQIRDYSDAALLALVQWITSDGALRTEDELIREASRELGFSRLGSQIRARIGAIVKIAR